LEVLRLELAAVETSNVSANADVSQPRRQDALKETSSWLAT